jgi:hypothetical protein
MLRFAFMTMIALAATNGVTHAAQNVTRNATPINRLATSYQNACPPDYKYSCDQNHRNCSCVPR